MKNRKLLVSSFLMIVTCCLLFAGTTFAWFSDSVSSNNNIITAGNLDVELQYSTDGKTWSQVESETSLFDEKTLWEPGHTEAVLLKVVNAGSLDFKYSLSLDVTAETTSVNVYGDAFKISDYLVVGAAVSEELNTSALTDRKAAADIAIENEIGFSVITRSAKLSAGKESNVQLVVYMPEFVGNEANHAKDAVVPSVKFGINVVASQINSEEDTFGPDYDKHAPWVGGVNTDWYFENEGAKSFTIATAEELAGLVEIVNGTATAPVTTYAATTVKDNFAGKTITLSNDLDLLNLEWTPIGTSANPFKGNFDGNGHTISNLKINKPSSSNVGLFGFTTDGEIKNVHVENASVTGRLNVGVVAGTPYTTRYDNITVTGNVTVTGMSYVGGVLGKNVYNDVTNVTVNVKEGSYVNANSVENGTTYRTYVGGVMGFVAEGAHTISNVTSNIDVLGSTMDIGGIAGIAHYGNNFVNCTSTGDVTLYNSLGDESTQYEIGGIAGVWHNQTGYTVTFTNCTYTGELSVYANDVKINARFTFNGLVGKAYGAGTGVLFIDGVEHTNKVDNIDADLLAGKDINLGASLTLNASTTNANSGYGATGLKVDGGTFNGNGNKLTVNGANGTWGCAINAVSGTIKNLTVSGAFRGIFMGGANGDVYIENVVLDGVTYTFNSDAGNKEYGVYISNSTLNGWTSFSDAHKEVLFTNCNFGKGNGYAFCRPYNDSVFTGCTFIEGFAFDASANKDGIVFVNCYVGNTLVTQENIAELLGSSAQYVTVNNK